MMRRHLAWIAYATASLSATLVACDNYDTVVSDGRVRVAEGAFTEAYVIARNDDQVWFAAVETTEAGGHDLEFMRFDGTERCTALHLETGVEEILSSSLGLPSNDPAIVAVVDGQDGVGTLHFIRIDCAEVVPPIANVASPLERLTSLGLTSADRWLATTEDGTIHQIDLAARTDIVVAESVDWHVSIGSDLWYRAHQQLFSIQDGTLIGPIGEHVTEATLGISAGTLYGYAVLYVDNGQVHVADAAAEGPPELLSEDTDVCNTQFMGGNAAYFAWTSPCNGGAVHIVRLFEHPAREYLEIPGPISNLIYRDGEFIFVRNPDTDPTVSLMTPEAGTYTEYALGSGSDVRSVRRRNVDGSDPSDNFYYVTLDTHDGSNAWGLWSPGTEFEALERGVGRVYLLSVDSVDERQQLLLVSSDELDGNANIDVYGRKETVHLATARNLRLDSLGFPFGSRAITFLQNFDTERGTGDLAGVSLSGVPVELEHGVSMYGAIELPVSAMLYTIPTGERRGLWMWIGGR